VYAGTSLFDSENQSQELLIKLVTNRCNLLSICYLELYGTAVWSDELTVRYISYSSFGWFPQLNHNRVALSTILTSSFSYAPAIVLGISWMREQ
jgi:hypothetical protein